MVILHHQTSIRPLVEHFWLNTSSFAYKVAVEIESVPNMSYYWIPIDAKLDADFEHVYFFTLFLTLRGLSSKSQVGVTLK